MSWDMYAPMGTYSPENLQRYGGRCPPPLNTGYYGQQANSMYNPYPTNNPVYSSYPNQPIFLNQNKMDGPKGYVPVYDTSSCLYSNKKNSNWTDYNDFKNMAKMESDPIVSAMARMEADEQYRNLTGKSNAGHEYYKNQSIQKLENSKERRNPF